MFNRKKFLKTKLAIALIAGVGFAGSAAAGLRYSFSIAIVSANYELITDSYEPNLLSGSSHTYTHKLYAVDFNPNEVQVQRRIRQGWSSDADPVKHCININGSRDNSCAWQNWDIDWTFDHSEGNFDAIDVYTSTISLPGNAYASWPLFPADEAGYQPNPNFVYYPPKTKFIIETRYYHPTAGWLYDDESFTLWCNGQNAWQHWSGQTTCPGL